MKNDGKPIISPDRLRRPVNSNVRLYTKHPNHPTIVNGKSQMKLKTALCCLAFLTTADAKADDPALMVRTAGRGDIEKVSDFLLFSLSKKYAVRVPQQVSAGESFTVQYTADGKQVQERFTVVDIAIRGDLCWLHSKMRSQGDTSPSDTIYVQPCSRVQ